MIDPIIEEQFKSLRSYYQSDEDVHLLDDAEKKIRESIKKIEVVNIGIFKEMTTAGEKAIADINFLLINEEEMAEKDRISLISKRKIHQFYLDRFTGDYHRKRVEAIKDFLATRVKAIVDNKN